MNIYPNERFLFSMLNFGALLSAVIMLTSCEATLFNSPQPVDSKNIYKFPKKFRGSWVVDGDTITIASDYYRSTTDKMPTKIINGIYVNPTDTMSFPKGDTLAWKKRMALSRPFASMQSITFDSLKNPMDTTTNYVIKGNMIYPIEKNGLDVGSTFYLEHDTIYRKVVMSTVEFELGRNAFLRKVSDNRYLVNLKAGLFMDVNPGWWLIYLIAIDKEGRISMHGVDQDKLNSSDLIYSDGDTFYLDSQWKTQDVQRLIQEGLFGSGDQYLENKNRIKLK